MSDNICVEDEEPSMKRRKLSEEERLHRCRERNRIHAKNTRERKKNMIEATQQRFITLHEEKARLSKLLLDTTVAGILISLSCKSTSGSSTDSNGDGTSGDDSSSKNSSLMTLEEIKNNCIHEMSDNEFDDDDDNEVDLQGFNSLKKDRSECTPEELEILRRERNRVHAKKTRLKKKKILLEMESSVAKLHNEVCELRKRYKVSQQIEKVDFTSSTNKSPRSDSPTRSPYTPSSSTKTSNTTYTLDDIAIHSDSDDEETKIIKSEIRKIVEDSSNSGLQRDKLTNNNNNGYYTNRGPNYNNNHMIYNNDGLRRQSPMEFNRPNFLRLRPPQSLPLPLPPHPIPILSPHPPSYTLSDSSINYHNKYNQHLWSPYPATIHHGAPATTSYPTHHPNYYQHFNGHPLPLNGNSSLRPYFDMTHPRPQPPRYDMLQPRHHHPSLNSNYTYNPMNHATSNNKRSNSECNNNDNCNNNDLNGNNTLDKDLLSLLPPFGAEVRMSALGL